MTTFDRPGISCLMVTQPGRERLVLQSIDCFQRQTHAPRELVIVHTGPPPFDEWLEHALSSKELTDCRVLAADGDETLGKLRNLSVEAARYPFVSQWDDDDLHHPEFLQRQLATLRAGQAHFCFLTDQWHYFENRDLVFWDDWRLERPPGDLIEGTLLGLKARMPLYPEIGIGEDTPLLQDIVSRGEPVARVSGYGWLMMYRWHGANAWDFGHHAAISRTKQFGERRLLEKFDEIARALSRYPLECRRVRFPHESGWLEFVIGDDGTWRYSGNLHRTANRESGS